MSWKVQPLSGQHERRAFACGQPWLDSYIRQHAIRNQELGYGRTYVAVSSDEPLIVAGFHTVSMGSVKFDSLPDALATRVPRYPMPVGHIGCLAVRREAQRKELGHILFVDALRRILTAADIIAARAVEVRAIDEAACAWYTGYGFRPFVDEPLHLYLPLTTARAIVAAAG